MSVTRALITRPRARTTRLIRAGGMPQAAGSDLIEIAASIGGVLAGALVGDFIADRVVRQPSLDPEPRDPEVLRRLVRVENEMRLRGAEERRSTYVVVGSILGGIAAPLLLRLLFETRTP